MENVMASISPASYGPYESLPCWSVKDIDGTLLGGIVAVFPNGEKCFHIEPVKNFKKRIKAFEEMNISTLIYRKGMFPGSAFEKSIDAFENLLKKTKPSPSKNN